jgi:hypothetical protein
MVQTAGQFIQFCPGHFMDDNLLFPRKAYNFPHTAVGNRGVIYPHPLKRPACPKGFKDRMAAHNDVIRNIWSIFGRRA